MYMLMLNDMRSSKIETLTPVMRSESLETLKAFVEGEKVSVYDDGPWMKGFRKGGPLEWYNRPYREADHFVLIKEPGYGTPII